MRGLRRRCVEIVASLCAGWCAGSVGGAERVGECPGVGRALGVLGPWPWGAAESVGVCQ